ncbi:MAG: flagellum-specific ATP synthase FliI, partial [Pseudomonadota bacterium]
MNVNTTLTDVLTQRIRSLEPSAIWGMVSAVDQSSIRLRGLNSMARAGDSVAIKLKRSGSPSDFGSDELLGEIVALNSNDLVVYPYGKVTGVRIGDGARLVDLNAVKISNDWLGHLIDPMGQDATSQIALRGGDARSLDAAPPPAALRRGFGDRMHSGLNVFDTFLPLCSGQRIGLFAAPGVGKSSLIADLAVRAAADVVVVGLIGERGREVRGFYDHALTDEIRSRTVVISATSDEPATMKKRAALLAMATAEHFRDQGKHVLLLLDSLTRFADAHREIALAAGEAPSIRAYPPSTFQALSGLVERAGPGADYPAPSTSVSEQGDITAVFTVLAAAGDMDAPVPDAIRGFLDGHVILDRSIAERGRFPAVDVLKSASRCLPDAASEEENSTLLRGR